MNVLEAFALHGSTSYGTLSPCRLQRILEGEAPTDAELPRVYQAVMEMPYGCLLQLSRHTGISCEAIAERMEDIYRESPQLW